MDVSRQTALEIFGLKENFSKEEVNKNFRRLSKIVHPDIGGDKNLFEFIMCCKDTLFDDSKANESRKAHGEPKSKESRKEYKKESVYVNLSVLYDIYYDLDEYTEKYDITEIRGIARIFIIPCRNKEFSESRTINFSQSFREFRELDFANFSSTVKLPEKLRKFKKFKIRVEFLGETFVFKLKMNKPFHIIKYHSPRSIGFNSIIELTFE